MIERIKNDNQGLSLIELVVSILMLGMITAMICVFVSFGTRSYSKISAETVLQQEAQMATSYIADIAVEAKSVLWESFVYDSKSYYVLTIQAPDTLPITEGGYYKDGDYYYFILYEVDSKILRFGRVKDTNLIYLSGTSDIDYIQTVGALINNKYALLSRYVNKFIVDFSGEANLNKLLQLQFEFSYMNKDYKATKNIICRNME